MASKLSPVFVCITTISAFIIIIFVVVIFHWQTISAMLFAAVINQWILNSVQSWLDVMNSADAPCWIWAKAPSWGEPCISILIAGWLLSCCKTQPTKVCRQVSISSYPVIYRAPEEHVPVSCGEW